MFYRSLLYLSICFVIGKAEAQDDYKSYTQNFTAHSSEAFAFSKIDNTPLNAFTGKIQLNLPVYQKKMSVLGSGVNLIYSGAGGLKKGEPGSIVGKGWLLNVGGMIIRNKRGVPDDYFDTQIDQNTMSVVPTKYNGILYNNGVTYWGDGQRQIPYGDNAYYYAEGIGDSQHDIFEFNIFGKSGKFYIGKNKEVLIVTDSKMKIIPDFTTSTLPEFKLGSFKVIDEAGIKYYFTEPVIGTENYQGPGNNAWYYNKPYATAWLLTKVEAPFNEETIIYEYTQRQTASGVGAPGSVFSKRSDLPSGEQSSTSAGTVSKEVDIKSITFSDQTKISFKYFEEANNNPTFPLLKSIEISNSQQETVKKFTLNYLLWQNADPFGSSSGLEYSFYRNSTSDDYQYFGGQDKVYLKSITQVSNSTTNNQTLYAFDYFNDANLNEDKVNTGVDYWGYYNGKNNATDFVVTTQWGPAADRTPDANYAKLGSLKKIIYPTGGSEEFDYELNDKRESGVNVPIGGLRIKKRILHDGVSSVNDIIKEYKYIETDGLSSGFLGETPQFTYVTNTYQDDGGWPSNPHIKYTTTSTFSTPVNPISSVEGSFVGYRRVEELQQNGTKNNGKIVYEFSDLSYASLWVQTDYFPYRPVDRPYWAVGLPVKTSYYLADGTTMLKQIVNEYNIVQQRQIEDNYRSMCMQKNGGIGSDDPDLVNPPSTYGFIYKFSNYYPVIGRAQLITSHEYDYSSGITKHQQTQNTYDANYYFLRTSAKANSEGKTVKKYFYYPFDYNLGVSSVTSKMTELNMISQPMMYESWMTTSAGNNYLVQSGITEYKFLSNNVIRPSKIYNSRLSQPLLSTPGDFSNAVLLPADHNFEPVITFNTYDSKNRLVEFEKEGGFKSAIIMDKTGNVLAKADNAAFGNIAYSGFETDDLGNWTYAATGVSTTAAKSGQNSYAGTLTKTGLTTDNYTVSLWAKGSGSVTVNGVSKTINASWALYKWAITNISSVSINTNGNLVDEVALSPQAAQMAMVNYDSEVKIENTSDLNVTSTYFEYDEFDRLKNVKNKDGNIVKEYEYKYNTPFSSVVKSGSFSKSTGSCPVGDYVPGPAVTYTVPAGKYISIISQADADAQAQSDVYVNGQSYADANGTCIRIYYNALLSTPVTRNNCPAGTVPSTVYYIVPAKKYSSTASQSDADNQATADATANAQNYANTNGVCAQAITVTVSNSTSDHFTLSFSGISTQYNIPSGSTNIVVPAGTYTVNIAPFNNNSHNFYVGGRTAIVGTSATFYNVDISNQTGSEKNIGIY